MKKDIRKLLSASPGFLGRESDGQLMIADGLSMLFKALNILFKKGVISILPNNAQYCKKRYWCECTYKVKVGPIGFI